MPPRRAAAPVLVAEAPDDFLSDEEAPAALSIAYDNPYVNREPRTLSSNHSMRPDHFGQVTAFKFADVLEEAYNSGFKYFTDTQVDVYPGCGHKGGPLAVVTVGAVFQNADGELITNYGTGDASPENCNSFVGAHFVRMAETRAQGRALARAMNLQAVLKEELLSDSETLPSGPAQVAKQAVRSSSTGQLNKAQMAEMPQYWPSFNNEAGDGFECEVCGEEVRGKSAFWANDKVGQIVCWDHQQELLKAKGA